MRSFVYPNAVRLILLCLSLLAVLAASNNAAAVTGDFSAETAGGSVTDETPAAIRQQDSYDSIKTGEWQVSLSTGHGAFRSPIIFKDNLQYYLWPDIAWYGEQLYFDNGVLGYALSEEPTKQWDLVLYPNRDGLYYHLSQTVIPLMASPREGEVPFMVVAEPKRKISAMGGLRYARQWSQWQTSLQWAQDVSGVHHGGEFEVSFKYPHILQRGAFNVGMGLELTYKSRQLVDYYYQLKHDEYIGDNPYDTHSGWTARYNLGMNYRIAGHWDVIGFYSGTWMSSAIGDSPLLKHRYISNIFSGLQYRF